MSTPEEQAAAVTVLGAGSWGTTFAKVLAISNTNGATIPHAWRSLMPGEHLELGTIVHTLDLPGFFGGRRPSFSVGQALALHP